MALPPPRVLYLQRVVLDDGLRHPPPRRTRSVRFTPSLPSNNSLVATGVPPVEPVLGGGRRTERRAQWERAGLDLAELLSVGFLGDELPAGNAEARRVIAVWLGTGFVLAAVLQQPPPPEGEVADASLPPPLSVYVSPVSSSTPPPEEEEEEDVDAPVAAYRPTLDGNFGGGGPPRNPPFAAGGGDGNGGGPPGFFDSRRRRNSLHLSPRQAAGPLVARVLPPVEPVPASGRRMHRQAPQEHAGLGLSELLSVGFLGNQLPAANAGIRRVNAFLLGMVFALAVRYRVQPPPPLAAASRPPPPTVSPSPTPAEVIDIPVSSSTPAPLLSYSSPPPPPPPPPPPAAVSNDEERHFPNVIIIVVVVVVVVLY